MAAWEKGEGAPTLGRRIQEGRVRLGLSQEGLGDRLGVSRQAVSKWEADAAVPDTDKLIALSRLFGVTLNQLLRVEDPPEAGGEAPEEERPAPEEAPPVRRGLGVRGAALLAVVCLLAGAAAGAGAALMALGGLEERVAALEETASAPDPGELAASWELSAGQSYVEQGVAVTDLNVQLTLARYDPEEELEVFLQVSDQNGTVVRAEAQERGGGVYTGTLALPQGSSGTLAVGFRKDGVEYLQPLVRIFSVEENGLSWAELES